VRQIETWFANKRRRTKIRHKGSPLSEEAKAIVKSTKAGKLPRGVSDVLRLYFDRDKLHYPTALQKQMLAEETVRCCLS
jgi:hypothetical protein